MLTIRLFAFIIGGGLFILIGYFGIKSKWVKSGSLSILIGLFLIYTPTIGPLSKSREIIQGIRTVNSNEVDSIKIFPSIQIGSKTIKGRIFITERNKIDSLCFALRNTQEEGEGFLKSPDWRAIVEIKLKSDNKIKFEVLRRGSVTGLNINSNGASGWHYGKLRADNFGYELDKNIK